MPGVVQVLIIADIDAEVPVEHLTALMPHERDRREILRLSEHGAPRLARRGASSQPVDWSRIGRAVEDVAARVRGSARNGARLELYIGGFAPLSVFVHLGYALTKFGGSHTFLHSHDGGPWVSYAIGAPEYESSPSHAPILNGGGEIPSTTRPTTGHVALYVDLQPRAAPVAAVRDLHERRGVSLGDILELRPRERVVLCPELVRALSVELCGNLARLWSAYPSAAGVTLLLATPAPIAFAVGRALNPTIARRVVVANYHRGTYEVAAEIPFTPESQMVLGSSEGDVSERARVRERLVVALADLQRGLRDEDLPRDLGDAGPRLVRRLGGLSVVDNATDEFELSITAGGLTFGTGLLEALRSSSEELVGRFGQLLILHELLHAEQGLRSTNYHHVGRAGVVLEQVDFAADVLSLRVVCARALRECGSDRAASDVILPWFEALVDGVAAFDKLTSPERIQLLPERRLRRDLVWGLQLARAKTVTRAEDVEALLSASVAVELAPLRGLLSSRHDKIVVDVTEHTELFCAVGGSLIRRGARGPCDPRALVEAVRTYDRDALQRAMHALVEENARVLAPWAP